MMGRFLTTCFFAWAACWLGGQSAVADPPAVATTTASTVLLLRNGRTIEGRVASAGEYYYVGVPNGKLRILADQVEFWCKDLEDGYRQKRAAVRPDTIEDHLRLAHWCLRQKLFGHAANELAAASRFDPTHPLIGLLQRQLAMVANPPAPRPPAVAAAPLSPGKDEGPAPEQLDAMIDVLPAESVETFTRSIQPLLVNTCGSAVCHGPGSEAGFQLRRIPLGRPASRLTTQQNLHEVLQWIDRLEPGSSPLLTSPAAPHGPAKSPVFSKTRAVQYERLAAWVRQVTHDGPIATDAAAAAAREPGGAIAAGATAVPGLLAQPAEPKKGPGLICRNGPEGASHKLNLVPFSAAPATEQAQPAGFNEPLPSSKPAEPQPGMTEELPLPANVQRGAKIEGFVPQDPFDPEQFNRRFFPQKTK